MCALAIQTRINNTRHGRCIEVVAAECGDFKCAAVRLLQDLMILDRQYPEMGLLVEPALHHAEMFGIAFMEKALLSGRGRMMGRSDHGSL